MRIYKDKKTGIYHADYVVNGRRVRPSLHTTNSTVATQRAADKIHEQKAIKGDINPINLSFKDFTTRFLASIRKAPKTMNTYKHAISLLEGFVPQGQNTPIRKVSEITPHVLNSLLDSLVKANPTQNAGINRNIRALKAMMRWGEKEIPIPKQDWERVEKLKEKKGRLEFHSPEEIKELLAKMPNIYYRLIVLLGARAGLRRGEMALLKWQDVDFKNARIYVAPNKTENDRYVPISDDLKKELLSAKKLAKNDFVICLGQEKARHSKDYLTAIYAKTTNKMPFHCTVHKLRHTFASHLVQNGVDLYTVSKLLGHTKIEMTEIYAHLAPDTFSAAIKKLPKI